MRADPDAGYGPGALAQKPVQRQPGGNTALNAPARTNAGRVDANVADPDGPQPKGSKQFSYGWDDLAAVIGLTKAVAMGDPITGGTVFRLTRDCDGGNILLQRMQFIDKSWDYHELWRLLFPVGVEMARSQKVPP